MFLHRMLSLFAVPVISCLQCSHFYFMKFCDTVVRFAIFPFFLPSPQTVSDGAVCLCKFH